MHAQTHLAGTASHRSPMQPPSELLPWKSRCGRDRSRVRAHWDDCQPVGEGIWWTNSPLSHLSCRKPLSGGPGGLKYPRTTVVTSIALILFLLLSYFPHLLTFLGSKLLINYLQSGLCLGVYFWGKPQNLCLGARVEEIWKGRPSATNWV